MELEFKHRCRNVKSTFNNFSSASNLIKDSYLYPEHQYILSSLLYSQLTLSIISDIELFFSLFFPFYLKNLYADSRESERSPLFRATSRKLTSTYAPLTASPRRRIVPRLGCSFPHHLPSYPHSHFHSKVYRVSSSLSLCSYQSCFVF